MPAPEGSGGEPERLGVAARFGALVLVLILALLVGRAAVRFVAIGRERKAEERALPIHPDLTPTEGRGAEEQARLVALRAVSFAANRAATDDPVTEADVRRAWRLLTGASEDDPRLARALAELEAAELVARTAERGLQPTRTGHARLGGA